MMKEMMIIIIIMIALFAIPIVQSRLPIRLDRASQIVYPVQDCTGGCAALDLCAAVGWAPDQDSDPRVVPWKTL